MLDCGAIERALGNKLSFGREVPRQVDPARPLGLEAGDRARGMQASGGDDQLRLEAVTQRPKLPPGQILLHAEEPPPLRRTAGALFVEQHDLGLAFRLGQGPVELLRTMPRE